MPSPQNLNPRFVTNQKGKTVAVLVPIKEYEELMEDLIDLAACLEFQEGETRPWAEVKERLIADGHLQA